MTAGTLANARDVATGLPAGRLVAGVLFRGDAPELGDTPPELPGWPPATVVDLRGVSEQRDLHPFHETAVVHLTPVLDAADPALLTIDRADRTLGVYRFMVQTPDSRAGIVAALEAIAAGPAPIFVHCTAGKDRTGVVVALILRLLGFDRSDVVAEYLLTVARSEALAARLVERGVVKARPGRARDLAPSAEPLEVALDEWDAHPDGARGWFLDAGGSAKTVRALEELLLP